jgi:CheY-like chemotaxis protein/DNA-directed RNA polymerase specialized sigma24 family protein
MSNLARDIAQQIPFMRRYARAVTGNQQRGDASVRNCLEELLRDPGGLDQEGLRIGLFRALNDALPEQNEGSHPVSGREPPIGDRSILVKRLGSLDSLKRRLLLLTALERFTLGQAAVVLRLAPEAAATCLEEAKHALREQRATRILVIEDEPVIALDIATTVERNGHTVVGIASTHAEAVDLARTGAPGLVLADIQLADQSSGLEAVQEILREIDVPVIFITAYPERLLTGERPEPTFLITKPFDPDTLAISIAQALATARAPAP